jgi:hypothetical protein
MAMAAEAKVADNYSFGRHRLIGEYPFGIEIL